MKDRGKNMMGNPKIEGYCKIHKLIRRCIQTVSACDQDIFVIFKFVTSKLVGYKNK